MRRTCFCVLGVCAAVLGYPLLVHLVACAEPDGAAGGVPLANGDVNGDGAIDMSDAIYLLDHLFLGGPAMVPLECVPTTQTRLPATGQTRCWDERGNPIACDGPTCPGQDGFYLAGYPIEERFVDREDGTVEDVATGLVWQKETAPGLHSWCQALGYCEGLELGGHDDWRLPNVRELQSLLDFRQVSPAIDPVFGAVADLYWSSTSSVNVPQYAWYVGFGNRLVSGHERENAHAVRAVRGGL
jgi:hypothetical protein